MSISEITDHTNIGEQPGITLRNQKKLQPPNTKNQSNMSTMEENDLETSTYREAEEHFNVTPDSQSKASQSLSSTIYRKTSEDELTEFTTISAFKKIV